MPLVSGAPRPRARVARGAASGFQAAFQRCDGLVADVGAAGRVDLARAGGAGAVDFGEALADHVQADEPQAAALEFGADGRGDLPVARAQRPRLAAPAGGEV